MATTTREIAAAPRRTDRRAALLSVAALPWPRLALGAVLALAALLNVWALNTLGYANAYYAAAVRSMLKSWHTFFFVSFDPGGFVSIDKPPLGFWIETASAKLFGYSGLSLLLPEALAGVLAVTVLYRLVARTWGRGAGLLAALALAVSPVSVAIARNNTIDSLLVLTVLLAAWAVAKAADTGRLRWLLLCALLVGLGFNIKMLQAYLVLPALGLVYLWGAPVRLLRRLGHLALATVVLLVVSFSWIVAVDLTPAALRPYVGSSGTNSELNLALGYNGLQRLLGGTGTPGGNGGGNPFISDPAGPFRLLQTTLGGQIGWLLAPALLGLLVAATRVPWRRTRVDARGRSLLLWGGWLLTGGAFFSVAAFFHPYYTAMLAPAVAALTAIGVATLWRAYRARERRGWLLPMTLLAAAGTQAYILRDYPAWSRWLTPTVVGLAVLAAAALVVARLRPRRLARVALVAVSVAVGALLLTPSAWAAYSVANNTSSGNSPTAGPVAASGAGMHGFGGPRGTSGTPGGTSGTPGGTSGASGGTTAVPSGTSAGPGSAGGPAGGPGGFGGGDRGGSIDAGLLSYLEAHQGSATYLVATPSSMDGAATIIIQTGKEVMALGGFSGGDQILTPAQLAHLVAAGTVHYFLVSSGGQGGPGGRDGGTDALTQWITAHGRVVPASQYETGSAAATSGGGQTLYYVSSAAAGRA